MDQILVVHCIFLSLKIRRNRKSLLYIAYFWHILQICQAYFDRFWLIQERISHKSYYVCKFKLTCPLLIISSRWERPQLDPNLYQMGDIWSDILLVTWFSGCWGSYNVVNPMTRAATDHQIQVRERIKITCHLYLVPIARYPILTTAEPLDGVSENDRRGRRQAATA